MRILVIEDNHEVARQVKETLDFRLGFIDAKQLEALAKAMLKNEYGAYLMEVLQNGDIGDATDIY